MAIFWTMAIVMLVGFVLLRLMPAVVKLAVSVSLAFAAGYIAAAVLGGESTNDENLGQILSFAFFLPIALIVFRLTRHLSFDIFESKAPSRPLRMDKLEPVEVFAPRPTARPPAAAKQSGGFREFLGLRRVADVTPAQVDLNWAALLEIAGGSTLRITLARRSCERLLAAAASGKTFDDPHELVNFVRKRVPEAIASCLRDIGEASGEVRLASIEDLVEVLEETAAEAEKLLARRVSSGNFDLAVMRQRLRAMAGKGPT